MAKHPHKTNDDPEVTPFSGNTISGTPPTSPVGPVKYGTVGIDGAGNIWISQPPRHGSVLQYVATQTPLT